MILLTGSSGFIGKNLQKAFPDQFICLIREGSQDNSLCKQSKIIAYGDGMFEGVTSVIHLGGLAHSNHYTKTDYQEVNVDYTLDLARKAYFAGVKRFIFVSSIGVNGSNTTDKAFTPYSPVNPTTLYGKSKLEAEVKLKDLSRETGFGLVIVRPTLVYGPRAPGNFGLLERAVRRFPLLPFKLVDNKRDFISVFNLADLLITCAKHPDADGHTFLASDGESISIKDFTNAIARGQNRTIIQVPVPIFFMRFLGRLFVRENVVEQLIGNLQVESSNLKKVLNWRAPYTINQAMSLLSGGGK